ncbi:MAG: ATP-binding protein [Oscillospiraceae bacterium]|nr:ATP-binding protein [Oscillospiraceae bacterium]
MSMTKAAPKRIAAAVLNALKGGVVPRVGLEYIAVGRAREIDALLKDTEIIGEGGAACRFVVGRYGSGKSFLLQTIRSYAMERGFAVADADLSPERRLSGTHGQGVATYRELMKNLSVRVSPDGGALPIILEKWITSVQQSAAEETGLDDFQSPAFDALVRKRILSIGSELEGMVNGYDFARVIVKYWQAYRDADEPAQSNALRWLRGEYASKLEVRRDLDARAMIDDDNWYEALKLFAAFLVRAGYSGLLVLIDEVVNLFRIPFRVTRQYNYEKLLSMYNDTLQGKASHLGLVFVVTPQSLEDTERGIFSYEALRSRLTEGQFADPEARDLLAPIIRISPLTYEEMYVLLEKLARLHMELYGYRREIAQEEYVAFLKTEYERIGASTHITPRSVIRDFVEILNRLYQYSEQTIADIVAAKDTQLTFDEGDSPDDVDGFASFTL